MLTQISKPMLIKGAWKQACRHTYETSEELGKRRKEELGERLEPRATGYSSEPRVRPSREKRSETVEEDVSPRYRK